MNKSDKVLHVKAKLQIMYDEKKEVDCVGLLNISQYNNRRKTQYRNSLEERSIFRAKRKLHTSDKMAVKFGI